MAKKLLSLVLALAMVSSFACISAFAADAKVYDGVTATLDLEGAFEADGDWGAIWAKNGAKLTINGDDATDSVKALLGEDGFSMAVYALGEGTEVVINGGYYTNEPDPAKPTQSDLIYAKDGAKITINGGTFECVTPQWTLNANDKLKGLIVVKGGKFYQFDPSNAKVGEGEIVVPEGYSVVKDGDWYEVVKPEPKVYDGVTATLDLEGAFEADGCDGAIWAKNGAKLTINGDDATDSVKSLVCTEHGYSMAVFAQDADVVINGGYYENEGDGIVDPNHVDLIYAKGNASITINGGMFKCANPQWTLNCKDNTAAVITVNGGKFYQFDPSNTSVAPAGKTEVVLGDGCKVVKKGDWYEVVKGEEAKIEFDSATSKVVDGKGALRFVFNVTLPEATETYFGAYMLPLNIFKSSGIAKAVQVQYAKTAVDAETSFSADLVKIPSGFFTTSIYAIPYIKTANGVVTFTGASASVNGALAE